MKPLNILLTFTLFLFINIPSEAQKELDYNPESLYPFEDYYINLDNLKRVEANGTPSSNFKTSSKYAERFIKASYDKVIFRDKEFIILPENGMKVVDLKTGVEKILENKEKDIEKDINGRSYVFSTNDGVVYLKKLDGEHGYMIYKYDKDGNEIFSLQIEHTDIIKEGNVRHHNPYLYYFMHTNDFLVFTSYDSRYEKSYVVNLETSDTDFFDFITAGVIRGEDENSIDGFIIIPDNSETIKVNYFDNSWQADVKQMNAEHSEYYNEVILSMYDNKIIMEGIESYAHYLQIFDIKTSKRLFTAVVLK